MDEKMTSNEKLAAKAFGRLALLMAVKWGVIIAGTKLARKAMEGKTP